LSKVVLRFEIFDTVNIKIVVFWVMMSFSVVDRCQHFGGMCYCMLHGGMHWNSCMRHCATSWQGTDLVPQWSH